MRYIVLVLAISLIATAPNVNAGVITLDFDTPETGSMIVTTPLVSPLGTITASASGVSRIFLIRGFQAIRAMGYGMTRWPILTLDNSHSTSMLIRFRFFTLVSFPATFEVKSLILR